MEDEGQQAGKRKEFRGHNFVIPVHSNLYGITVITNTGTAVRHGRTSRPASGRGITGILSPFLECC